MRSRIGADAALIRNHPFSPVSSATLRFCFSAKQCSVPLPLLFSIYLFSFVGNEDYLGMYLNFSYFSNRKSLKNRRVFHRKLSVKIWNKASKIQKKKRFVELQLNLLFLGMFRIRSATLVKLRARAEVKGPAGSTAAPAYKT